MGRLNRLDTEFASYFAAAHYSCVIHVRKSDETLFVGDGGSDELNGGVRVRIGAV